MRSVFFFGSAVPGSWELVCQPSPPLPSLPSPPLSLFEKILIMMECFYRRECSEQTWLGRDDDCLDRGCFTPPPLEGICSHMCARVKRGHLPIGCWFPFKPFLSKKKKIHNAGRRRHGGWIRHKESQARALKRMYAPLSLVALHIPRALNLLYNNMAITRSFVI